MTMPYLIFVVEKNAMNTSEDHLSALPYGYADGATAQIFRTRKCRNKNMNFFIKPQNSLYLLCPQSSSQEAKGYSELFLLQDITGSALRADTRFSGVCNTIDGNKRFSKLRH